MQHDFYLSNGVSNWEAYDAERQTMFLQTFGPWQRKRNDDILKPSYIHTAHFFFASVLILPFCLIMATGPKLCTNSVCFHDFNKFGMEYSYLRSTPPRSEALRHSGGERRLWTSATVTLYLDVLLSNDRRPGTEQKTSAGEVTPDTTKSLLLSFLGRMPAIRRCGG